MSGPSTQRKRRSSAGQELTLLLEEAKGLPVFWSGNAAVPKLVWRIPSSYEPKLTKMTISEVLEKFAAAEYVKHCTVTLPDSSRPSGSHLKMSDNFSSLWADSTNRAVKLILEGDKGERPAEISSKYMLILSEGMKKRIFWDGRQPQANLMTRISEAQMLTTLETTLRKYMPLDYLRKAKFELVGDKRRSAGGPQRHISLHNVMGSIFTETTASLRVSFGGPQGPQGTVADKEQEGEEELTKVMSEKSLESFWLTGNWNEIREKVQYLLEALELMRIERQIPQEFDSILSNEKQNLEVSLRRRNRSVDEVLGHYERLKSHVQSGIQRFPYKMSPSSPPGRVPSSSEAPPPSDSGENLELRNIHLDRQTTTSMIDVVAHHLRTGLGVEILDDDARVTPLAGMALTLTVVLTICILSNCVR